MNRLTKRFITGTIAHYPLPTNTILKFVPQQQAWIVERMGKFNRVLDSGPNVLIPILDQVKYVANLKEIAISIPSQSAITQDNVSLEIDGVLYVKVTDPYKTCYGITDAEFSVVALAQTSMRSEIGKLSLDRTLSERQHLNQNIVQAITEASQSWGIDCLRYEIRDIHPPENIVVAMQRLVEADRQKRAEILQSEGDRQSQINKAEGLKVSTILEAEAGKEKVLRQAEAEAQSVLIRAQAKARAIEEIQKAIQEDDKAVKYIVAEKYIEAFGELAKKGTTILMDSNKSGGLGGVADASAMVASAMGVYSSIQQPNQQPGQAKVQQQVNKRDFPLN